MISPDIRFFNKLSFLLTLLALSVNHASAVPISSESLISNCQELIAIYDKNHEQKLLAGISTSVAEAMRAGICRGMIEEHLYHSSCRRGWHAIATDIATGDSDSSVERILERACGG